MAILITLLIFFSAIAYLFSRIKKSQDQDKIENYSSTDDVNCRETHSKFFEQNDVGPFWCPICGQNR